MAKKITKILLLAILVLPFFSITNAQTADCRDSFAPQFICERFAGLTSDFTFGKLLDIFFLVAIAALIIFILYQIIVAIFKWVNKASDEKSRGEAIKALSNAAIAFIVMLVMIAIVTLTSGLLGIGGKPNPLYACYPTTVFGISTPSGIKINIARDVDPYTGTLKTLVTVPEMQNVYVYEGEPPNGKQYNKTDATLTKGAFFGVNGGTPGGSTAAVFNQSVIDFLQGQLYCQDKNTGKETENTYVILKRIGIKV